MRMVGKKVVDTGATVHGVPVSRNCRDDTPFDDAEFEAAIKHAGDEAGRTAQSSEPTHIDLAIATPYDGSVRLTLTCEGKMRSFLAKPSVAASLAGELAKVLATLVSDAEAAGRS